MTRQRVTAVHTFLFLTACGIAFLIGQHAGHTDRHELVTPTVTVTTAPAWADGCTTDLDCIEMERSLNDAGLYLVGGGGVTTDPGQWQPVTQELADALAEGDDTPPENADTRDWEACLVNVGDTTVIVCPDGYVTTS